LVATSSSRPSISWWCIDADVADETYDRANVKPDRSDLPLPCAKPCPPAASTTDALRAVVLSWCREASAPSRTVLCTPSKSTEAWVVTALFPGDGAVKKGIECFADPEQRLTQQPKRVRIEKSVRDYRGKAAKMDDAWSIAVGRLTELERFQVEVRAAIDA
jgi:hypothetical protein